MKIKLSQGKFALIDRRDFKRVSKFKWHFYKNPKDKTGYAIHNGYDPLTGKRPRLRLHRFILNAKPHQFIDHANRNGLDNRRSNLRFCKLWQNAANKPSYRNLKGVSRTMDRNKVPKYWIARITKNGKRKYLGTFPTKEIAFLAYKKASQKLHGEFSCL